MPRVDPYAIAQPFLDAVREEIEDLSPIRLVGILGNDARPSKSYSSYAKKGCAKVGIDYQVRRVAPEAVSREIWVCNEDPEVHGVIVYYPIFGGARDRSLQNEVDPEKDVEGLHTAWTRRLYHDVRYVDDTGERKAILPCTPLAIVKALEALGVFDLERGPRHHADGLTAAIFNRSEVVGRPLAALMAHDGATVYSFDVDGVMRYDRATVEQVTVERGPVLAAADVVVTAVPAEDFEKVRAEEIKPGAAVIDVSFVGNLGPGVKRKAAHALTRVGPITVAMLLRNTLRLYKNFHGEGSGRLPRMPEPEE